MQSPFKAAQLDGFTGTDFLLATEPPFESPEAFDDADEFEGYFGRPSEAPAFEDSPLAEADLEWHEVESWMGEALEYEALEYEAEDQETPPWVFGEEHESPPPLPGFLGFSLSAGGFGKAMRRFSERFVPDGALWLLKQSPRFMAVVKDLDAAYVDDMPDPAPAQNDAGVFLDGPKGKRWLHLQPSSNGSRFVPYAAAGNNIDGDIMFIEGPDGAKDALLPAAVSLTTKGQWIERIAHEAIHAQRHVQGRRRPGSTPAQRIAASIDDEIATRRGERAIVDELRRKFSKFRPYQPTTGSFDRPVVERDFFPGEQRRTYLEQFVLGELLADAAKQLTDAQRKEYAQLVGKVSLGRAPHAPFLSMSVHVVHPKHGRIPLFRLAYPNVLLAMRVIDARWRTISDLDSLPWNDPTVESMRQEHANAFFGGLVTYTAVP